VKTLSLSVRAAIAACLFAAAPLAMAQVYTDTPLPGTAQALAPNGSVVGANPYTFAYSSVYQNYVLTNSYYVTGANGVGTTSLGNDLEIGDFGDGGMNGLNIFSAANDGRNMVSHGSGFAQITTMAAGTVQNTSATPEINAVGINNAGAIAANLSFNDLDDTFLTTGAVHNADGSTTYLGQGSVVTGINASGAVAYTGGSGLAYAGGTGTSWHATKNAGTVSELAAGSTTPTQVAGLGFGGVTGGINSTGQMTGAFYNAPLEIENYQGVDSFPNGGTAQAFRTGANGVGTTLFGVANGVSSQGVAINDAGQVGGFVTLAGGQTEAFLTSTHGGLLVGLGAGSSSDSTQVDFLNNSGQALIDDTTTGVWYLYASGVITNLYSLVPTWDGSSVVGFNDAGQILFSDPDLETPDPSQLTAANLANVYGGTDVTTTQAFQDMASAQGLAPDAGFFTDPNSSDDPSFSSYDPVTYVDPVQNLINPPDNSGDNGGDNGGSATGGDGGDNGSGDNGGDNGSGDGSTPPSGDSSSVPAPTSLGLLGLGLLAAGMRRRKGIVGVITQDLAA
jgi:PEP-CTERM motif